MEQVIASFEKKGIQIEVVLKGTRVYLVANGVKASADPLKHSQHGWYYRVAYKKAFTSLFDKKSDVVNLVHESAEIAKQMIDEAVQREKEEKQRKLEEKFQSLTNDSNIRLVWGTDYGTIIVPNQPELSEHPFFKQVIEILKETGWYTKDIEEAIGRKADDVDFGDYSITHYYDITIEELKQLVAKAEEVVKQKEKQKEAEKAELQAKFDEAKRTGQKVEIRRWTDDCNDPKEECDLDIVIEYAMPDGSVKVERHHTW
ncbi:hypothetical protein [Parageobacillus thermoglucosidasius]|uniref:hypothetical protein n=1 Tax=Parageobacillus thermoglucosidasius TaxID=1426 RepID=UPI002E1DC0BD|nr:hypothetical protein [Parageobacillus thermoglucosidasius]MED4946520.1 hypothetical protein [Parageobacillus thermoglucosidasius]MED4984081.1 hypothetical protein [Parageobacillus thermoglucosidasius]